MNIPLNQLEEATTLQLISNVNLIYNLLIGLTDLCKHNYETVKATVNDNNYYTDIDVNNELEIKQKL